MLKLSDIVRVSKIDQNTAQYILKPGNVLPAMPRSQGQGKHRSFTLRQSMQLVVCTLLVRGGMPRDVAGNVVRYCEKIAEGNRRKRERANRDSPLYQSKLDDHWILTVDDHRFCRLWRKQIEQDTHLRDEDDFFDLLTGENVHHFIRGFTRFEVAMTALEGVLSNALRRVSQT